MTGCYNSELVKAINDMLADIQDELFNRAKKVFKENITTVEAYDELKEGGFVRACWCSSQTCEERIKEETGATLGWFPSKRRDCFYVARIAAEE